MTTEDRKNEQEAWFFLVPSLASERERKSEQTDSFNFLLKSVKQRTECIKFIRSVFSGAVLIIKVKPDVVAHSHDPSNQEVEVGEHELEASLGYISSSRLPWVIYRNHISKQTRKSVKILRKIE